MYMYNRRFLVLSSRLLCFTVSFVNYLLNATSIGLFNISPQHAFSSSTSLIRWLVIFRNVKSWHYVFFPTIANLAEYFFDNNHECYVILLLILFCVFYVLHIDCFDFTLTSRRIKLRSMCETRAQIHRYCLKIYPKMCHKIILRQKL